MTQTLTFRAVVEPEGLRRDRAIEVDEDGLIVDVRPGTPPYDGFLALPGMPNAHSHVFQRALAGYGEAASGDDSFWTWRQAMYRLAGSVTPSQLYAVARYAYAEMLRAGYTHVVEFHYLHHAPDGARGPETTDAVLRAAADVGLPISLVPVYYRTSGFDGAPVSPEQQRFGHASVEDFLALVEALGPAAVGVAPHSLRAAPPSDLEALVNGADALLGDDAPLHIHVSEQAREVEQCRDAYGATPIELLDRHVELGPRWNLVHATHATPRERDRIRSTGARVVLCPLTEAYLGDGIFEAFEHFRAGGAAAVGSDANVRISPIEELRQLEYGQRLRDRRRARLATDRGVGLATWSWLAAGGGDAAPASAKVGRVAPGFRADLVVLDETGPAIRGHGPSSALDAWIVGGDSSDIATVYVAGRPMALGGSVEGESTIAADFEAAMKAIWSDDA